MKKEHSNLKSWTQIKDDVYGKKGSPRRDELDRDIAAFKIGLLIRQARESKKMTQEELANRTGTRKSFISRIENGHSDIQLSTLYKLIEQGLGKKISLSIR